MGTACPRFNCDQIFLKSPCCCAFVVDCISSCTCFDKSRAIIVHNWFKIVGLLVTIKSVVWQLFKLALGKRFYIFVQNVNIFISIRSLLLVKKSFYRNSQPFQGLPLDDLVILNSLPNAWIISCCMVPFPTQFFPMLRFWYVLGLTNPTFDQQPPS